VSNNPPKYEPPSSYEAKWYILKYRKPVRCYILHKVNNLMRAYARRRIRSTYIGKYWVSTVFLLLDHNHSLNGLPVLFETIVFKGGGMSSEETSRTTTWRKALKQHWQAVSEVKQIIKGKDGG